MILSAFTSGPAVANWQIIPVYHIAAIAAPQCWVAYCVHMHRHCQQQQQQQQHWSIEATCWVIWLFTSQRRPLCSVYVHIRQHVWLWVFSIQGSYVLFLSLSPTTTSLIFSSVPRLRRRLVKKKERSSEKNPTQRVRERHLKSFVASFVVVRVKKDRVGKQMFDGKEETGVNEKKMKSDRRTKKEGNIFTFLSESL